MVPHPAGGTISTAPPFVDPRAGFYARTLASKDRRASEPLGPSDTPANGRPTHSGRPMVAALQEQLGFMLEAQRGRVDVVVIESAERPTPD